MNYLIYKVLLHFILYYYCKKKKFTVRVELHSLKNVFETEEKLE
jgi:hypothetical protein